MAEEKIRIPVRSALVPVFYKNFHCLAQDCRDSCCVGWSITFDKKDYLRLRRLDAPEALRERLEQGVRRERKGAHDGLLYGKFDLKANRGRCPFLEPDGLCGIQRACGHEALPHVCRSYPRRMVYTPVAKEYSLSPSCEGVLRQLWDLPEGVEFEEDPLPKTEYKDVIISTDEKMKLYFEPIRALCIDILQNRAVPLSDRMLCLGVVLQNLREADWADFDPDGWTGRMAALSGAEEPVFSDLSGNRKMYLLQNLKVLDAVSATGERWTAELYEKMEVKRHLAITQADGGSRQVGKYRVQYSQAAYEDALAQFQAAFPDREYFFENLMVAVALYLSFPDLAGKEALWKSYISLCNLYSFFRFVSVAGCKDSATKEQLFHMIAMTSRAALHNRDRLDRFQKELFQNDSSTLAHMAILING